MEPMPTEVAFSHQPNIRCNLSSIFDSSYAAEPKNDRWEDDASTTKLPSKIEGFYIWYADIRSITTDAEFQSYLSRLNEQEKSKVMAYRLPDDRKRSILSIFLQKALIRLQWNVNDSEYFIFRTKEVYVVIV